MDDWWHVWECPDGWGFVVAGGVDGFGVVVGVVCVVVDIFGCRSGDESDGSS